ncbi:restriction endonuclease subunit S [Priestia sp. YIM B13551]|uniref:restriction endonuclease subunit S n=1 Tax=Priestia sp. YIM B13551 TaxID=3366306 RepID=UPI003671A239
MRLYNIRLGDICKVKGGFAFKSKDFIDNGVPVIKIANIYKNEVVVNQSTSYVDSGFLDKYKDFIVKEGSLLIALSGATTGKFGIYKSTDEALLNQRVAMIVPDEDKTTTKFIYYCLQGLQKQIFDKALGAAQPNISPKEIEEFSIMFGGMDYQNKVVKLLDTAQILIKKRKEQISALSSLRQSVFLDMFSNYDSMKKVKISELIDSLEAGLSTGGESKEKQDGEYGVLTVGAVTKGVFNPKAYKVPTKEIKNPKRIIHPTKQSILFSRANTRELVGASCIVERDYGDLFIPDKIWKIKLNLDCVNPYYFVTFIQQEFFRKKLSKEATGTSGSMLNISQQKFKNMEIYLPSISQQNEFAEVLERISFSKSKLEKSLVELENNFSSLMQQAFKGELFN